MIYQDEFETNL